MDSYRPVGNEPETRSGDQMRAGFWKTGRPDQLLNYDHLEVRPLGSDSFVSGRFLTRWEHMTIICLARGKNPSPRAAA
jgi:hypothetical protein